MNTLADALFDGWAGDPRVFVHLPDGSTITHGEFWEMSSHLAAQLRRRGVTPGARVAVQVEKSPQALALYAACVRIGAVFLPLNTAYTAEEIAYFLADAQPVLLVCDAALDGTSGEKARCVNIATAIVNADGSGDFSFEGSAPSVQNAACPPEAPASILYTSGTTGKAKGAVLSHLNLLSNARVLAKFWRFDEDDILLHILPVFHVHGLFTAVNTVLAAGASLLFMPAFDAARVCALMPRATAMMGVPTHYTRLLACPQFTRECAADMRLFISGSTPLPAGDIGSIEIKGDNVFCGYRNKPQQTAESFRQDGYFITGDIGLFDADGYLNIIGRAKDMIISGGLNVYPKEVEAGINALPGVLESAVIGVPHADFGEAVVAAVVASAGKTLAPAEIISALGGKLAKFKLPKQVYIVPELPRNTMGKVQKNRLRDKYRNTFT